MKRTNVKQELYTLSDAPLSPTGQALEPKKEKDVDLPKIKSERNMIVIDS